MQSTPHYSLSKSIKIAINHIPKASARICLKSLLDYRLQKFHGNITTSSLARNVQKCFDIVVNLATLL